ncbi:serine/threonine protein phosphatase (plasmid) [Pseudorhodobacter turbinis]|uniref:Serine/threonine protein phosphatase n=1 Tax=Pseudorhodobacter turbinis TaxID=2500533 RepID=A0A4P8EKA5_9RHOB|nr:metallophosphoesterase [Pseudorhodobacter turbinis]QCO57641.1 serine/threonine protein phosphatase [Pseudorhodobacter turbinis]
MRSYAIGDIHGHLDLLQAAHARIAADKAASGDTDAPIIHIGDLVDRGPDCRAVIDYLAKGVAAGENWVVLKGNHDRMFTDFLNDPAYHDPGLKVDYSYLHPKIGGRTTLASYGVANAGDRPVAPVHAEAVAAVPQAHRDFLQSRPTYFERGEVMFVHAGVRPGIAIEDQAEDDLLWIRVDFLDYRGEFPWLLVHGHTALPAATHYGNRVNIDSSAAYGGPLTAVVVEGRDVFVLTDEGRVPLTPTPDAPIR